MSPFQPLFGAWLAVLPHNAHAIIMRHDIPRRDYLVEDADWPALVDMLEPGDCMGTLIHEHIHLMLVEVRCECGKTQENWPEEKVLEWENIIADNLWAAGYRRIQP